MEYQTRTYPLFSACGLNCGLCPRFHTDGASKCPGCAGEGFLTKHPTCGILSCCGRKEIEYCCLCQEYSCKKYDKADEFDSFITHKNQLRDLEKMRKIGLEAYIAELNDKVRMLEKLLEHYDDGRRKSFFCTAVNLLSLQDIHSIMKQAADSVGPDIPRKEKCAAAIRLFEKAAEEQGILLKLRKKEKR